jgi:hypothetical protein
MSSASRDARGSRVALPSGQACHHNFTASKRAHSARDVSAANEWD